MSNTATVSSKALDTNPANDTATIGSSVVASPTVQPVKCVVPKLKGLRLKGARKRFGRLTAHRRKSSAVTAARSGKGASSAAPRRRARSYPPTKVKLTVSRGAKHKAHRKPKSNH